MSESSSDSDSSCGWTVINHEGSDIEIVNSATASDNCGLTLECSLVEQEELPVLYVGHGGEESSANNTSSVGETMLSSMRETKSAAEVEEAPSPEDNVYFGTTSDDSDIVTLEPPKLEEMGNQEVTIQEAPSSDDLNMGSSSSSQYAFCQPEPVFSSQPSDEESSSDDTSHEPSPAPRRRRNRKKTVSISESEEPPLAEPEDEPSKEPSKRHFSRGLNKCVILALVIAVSMGFGHFYGTIQIQKQLVRKTHEDELDGVKGYLSQRKQEQESFLDFKSLKENLERCWTVTESEKITFETQKKNLAAENQYLRISLEKEEQALSSLQEELRQLREQIRLLEDKGTSTQLVKETFDAMKNSTKEFVRHHKEKIKQAKEAVKENLKKFSDSVKSTFRHFKDTTKNIFDEKGSKRFRAPKEAATEKTRTAYSYSSYSQQEAPNQNQNCRRPSAQRDGGREKPSHSEEIRKNANSYTYKAKSDCRGTHSTRRVCSGMFECAGQEAISPVNKASPVRMNDFKQLIHWYLLNGVFRHDQQLFADFVDDVKGYLKSIKEYRVEDGNLEKLDGCIYRHFGHVFALPFGPSRPDKKQRMVTIENARHRKQEQKHLHPQPYEREGKWQKYGRANGRHTANLELELGQLPFDPKY